MVATAIGFPPIMFRRLLQSNGATTVLDFTPRRDQPPLVTVNRLNQVLLRPNFSIHWKISRSLPHLLSASRLSPLCLQSTSAVTAPRRGIVWTLARSLDCSACIVYSKELFTRLSTFDTQCWRISCLALHFKRVPQTLHLQRIRAEWHFG